MKLPLCTSTVFCVLYALPFAFKIDYKRGTMKQSFLKISVQAPKTSSESAYAFLYQLPYINGLEENDTPNERIRLDAYMPASSSEETLSGLLKKKKIAESNGLDINVSELEYDPALETEWKKYFKPQKIGRSLVIKPSWETYLPNSKDILITIDPGTAFGTGLHETTRSVLILLEDLLYEMKTSGRDLGSMNLLDAGTGSGILAIAAYKMGVRNIKAIDFDYEAVETATHNILINSISQKEIRTQTMPIGVEEGTYDIVLANILADVLIESKSILKNMLKDKNSRMVLSGILVKEETKIADEFQREGFELLNRVHMNEWCSLLLKLK
jgi:ribosomal protein L11 methyltransferase